MSNYSSGDLLITSGGDGGEITVENDFFLMTDGFKTAVYLSLFGGNNNDNGTESTKNNSWWGNQLNNNEPSKLIISRTMTIIKGLPATPSNLNKLSQAINDDLAWFKNDGICDTINVNARIPQRNRLELEIELIKEGEILDTFTFIENWKGMKNEP